jgi:hypothetical protein
VSWRGISYKQTLCLPAQVLPRTSEPIPAVPPWHCLQQHQQRWRRQCRPLSQSHSLSGQHHGQQLSRPVHSSNTNSGEHNATLCCLADGYWRLQIVHAAKGLQTSNCVLQYDTCAMHTTAEAAGSGCPAKARMQQCMFPTLSRPAIPFLHALHCAVIPAPMHQTSVHLPAGHVSGTACTGAESCCYFRQGLYQCRKMPNLPPPLPPLVQQGVNHVFSRQIWCLLTWSVAAMPCATFSPMLAWSLGSDAMEP